MIKRQLPRLLTQEYELIKECDNIIEQVIDRFDDHNKELKPELIKMIHKAYSALQMAETNGEFDGDKRKHIEDKIGDRLPYVWLVEALPANVEEIIEREKEEAVEKFIEQHRKAAVLKEGKDIGETISKFYGKILDTLMQKEHEEILQEFNTNKEMDDALKKAVESFKKIRPTLDNAEKAIDLREWISPINSLSNHIMDLATPLRYIADVFAISAKWAGKEIKKNITKLKSPYLILNRDYKKYEKVNLLEIACEPIVITTPKGEQVNILPLAFEPVTFTFDRDYKKGEKLDLLKYGLPEKRLVQLRKNVVTNE